MSATPDVIGKTVPSPDLASQDTHRSVSDDHTTAWPAVRRRFNAALRGALFLCFALAGFAVFALATLGPLLEDGARLRAERRALQREVDRLERRLADLAEFAAAITDDALTNERLAKIDLAYQKSGEEIVAVDPGGLAPPPGAASPRLDLDAESIVPDSWPDTARIAEAWLADRGLLNGFLDPRMRGTWLLLAAGMIVAAFVIFAPRRRQRRPT